MKNRFYTFVLLAIFLAFVASCGGGSDGGGDSGSSGDGDDGSMAVCDANNRTLCTDATSCSFAGGFWYDNLCNQNVCDANNLTLCTDTTSCSGAGGFWYDNLCNQNEQATPFLTHVSTYDLPARYYQGNYLFDQSKMIFAGGQTGLPSGAQHDGHPAFSDQVFVIDFATETKTNYQISAESGHAFGDTVGNGIGNQSIVQKISDDKYLIYGGFQYVTSLFILDTHQATIHEYHTDITFTDDTGLNTTPFFANYQASAILENGDFVFFGFNNGLYGMSAIIIFDSNSLSFQQSSTALTMRRSDIDAYMLPDGRILLVGGWDGTASVLPDSATRRTEIYDPSTDTIARIADYPEPRHNGQHRLEEPTTNDAICVGEYKFNLSDNSWVNGCDIAIDTADDDEILTYNNRLPDGYGAIEFIGRTSGGQLVFLEPGWNNLPFSDECSCEPYTEGAKVHVFSE